ncbi:MAG: crossover junction endodeoxyribonuclease RuvC [Pseudomonadota bacterium]|jgi:crossover junction endodeoxyribonuclease RuvC
MRVMGIDPGSRRTGWGVVERVAGRPRLVAAGAIATNPKDPMPQRLRVLHEGLRDLLAAHRPDAVAIEEIFAHRSAASAIVLGQARGVALAVVALADVPLHGYNAMVVKRTVAGSGSADKAAMQRMVALLLGEEVAGPADAADAVAIAITHQTHAAARPSGAGGGVAEGGTPSAPGRSPHDAIAAALAARGATLPRPLPGAARAGRTRGWR